MKNKIITLLYILIPFISYSQEQNTPFYLNFDMASRYVWRGLEYGTSPVLFSSLGYNNSNLNVYVMGAYSINNSHSEVDCGITYTIKNVTLGLSDYYFPSQSGEPDSYFNFSKDTNHNVESYCTYRPGNAPYWVTLSMFIFGNDKEKGKQAYSSYGELGFYFISNPMNSLSTKIGLALNKSFYNDYNQKISVVDISINYTKNVKLKNKNIPLSVSYIVNPYRNKSYFVSTISLNV